MLSAKDEATLINKPNNLLGNSHDRAMSTEVPESILSFYENNAHKINAKVVVVRTKKDEPTAALARNSGDKVLFLFGDKYWVTNYFSSTCQNILIPCALIKRSNS